MNRPVSSGCQRNGVGVVARLGVLLVLLAMGQAAHLHSDPLRLSKRSPMDLRISKRSLDTVLEEGRGEGAYTDAQDNYQEDKRSMLRLSKRDVLRLSKKDLLRLSKKDLLRLSKRDLLRLSKRAEEDETPEFFLPKRLPSSLRLSKRPAPVWPQDDTSEFLMPKRLPSSLRLSKRSETEVPMIIRLSKRELGHLLQLQQLMEQGSPGLRISKRAAEGMID